MYDRTTLLAAVGSLTVAFPLLVGCGQIGGCNLGDLVEIPGEAWVSARTVDNAPIEVLPGRWTVTHAGPLYDERQGKDRPAVEIDADVEYPHRAIEHSRPTFWESDLPGECVAPGS